MTEERVTGTVTTEIKSEGSGQELQGRISYENRGECFFLPYNKDDVEGNVTLRSGDKVSFQIAANQRYVRFCRVFDLPWINLINLEIIERFIKRYVSA